MKIKEIIEMRYKGSKIEKEKQFIKNYQEQLQAMIEKMRSEGFI